MKLIDQINSNVIVHYESNLQKEKKKNSSMPARINVLPAPLLPPGVLLCE